MGELNFTKPINAVPRDGYGSRGGTHKGVDYPASEGTPVQASESGVESSIARPCILKSVDFKAATG